MSLTSYGDFRIQWDNHTAHWILIIKKKHFKTHAWNHHYLSIISCGLWMRMKVIIRDPDLPSPVGLPRVVKTQAEFPFLRWGSLPYVMHPKYFEVHYDSRHGITFFQPMKMVEIHPWAFMFSIAVGCALRRTQTPTLSYYLTSHQYPKSFWT